MREKPQSKFNQTAVMFLISVFQVICMMSLITNSSVYASYLARLKEGETALALQTFNTQIVYIFLIFIAAEWVYMVLGTLLTGHDYFELEAIAFFLCGIGLTVCASFGPDNAVTQLIAIGLGIIVYIAVSLFIKDVNFACFMRTPAAAASVALLAFTLITAQEINGTKSWIYVGGMSLQPSEIVKVAFILVGAASLEKLLSMVSLTKYIVFSVACVGLLFVMKDFGTALIFFFTFILIAFMRSGDMRTIILICAVALMGAILILIFKESVRERFEGYRHVWENTGNSKGYQQSRVLTYIASGGLLGLGIGQGKLRNIYAASSDLVFGVVCEEMGIIVGLAVLASFVGISLFAIHASKTAGSTFYTISAVSAAGMIMFQLSLNVFGITDLLPLTGVTLPFVSEGGSSMICCWGLLAYIRAAGAPFTPPKPDAAVKKPPAASKKSTPKAPKKAPVKAKTKPKAKVSAKGGTA